MECLPLELDRCLCDRLAVILALENGVADRVDEVAFGCNAAVYNDVDC